MFDARVSCDSFTHKMVIVFVAILTQIIWTSVPTVFIFTACHPDMCMFLVQLCESLFQHKAKMISLLDPHTHTYKLASQADHVSDAEV